MNMLNGKRVRVLVTTVSSEKNKKAKKAKEEWESIYCSVHMKSTEKTKENTNNSLAKAREKFYYNVRLGLVRGWRRDWAEVHWHTSRWQETLGSGRLQRENGWGSEIVTTLMWGKFVG